MRRAVARWLLPLLIIWVPVSGWAEIVRDLYTSQVPVANQSPQALAKAASEALAEVLVKVSGSVDVLKNPAIAAELPKARTHVLKYAYAREEGDQQQLTARFEFDDSYVTRLVTGAGAPLWTANRPLVLAWLVVEDASGRHFVNWESAPELSARLLAEFSRRGVPVQLPLFDLTDAAAISTGQAWQLSGPALQSASGRYDVQAFLAGRLVMLSTGKSTGDWSYFANGDRIDRSVSAANAEDFVRAGVAIVAEDMAARYAIAPSGGAHGGVTMLVTGVNDYAAYANIVSWLEGLELIEHANVERVSADQLALRLHAQADASQLAPVIELNKRLQPVAPPSPEVRLSYQWLR